jgi:NADH-quinone oxidoreductase subunit N
MFYGNLVALAQDNLKRMLAYSSIAQAGYILIGVALQNANGISASLFQIFAHVFLFIGAMSIVAWLEGNGKDNISDLIGLYKENMFCAIALTIFLVGLLGVPFTTGFVGKFLLFLGAIKSGMAWLAIIGIINSAISAFYYIKVISAVYTNKVGAYRIRIGRSTLLVIGFCLAMTLVFGVYPQPVIQAANGAAAYLFSGRVV